MSPSSVPRFEDLAEWPVFDTPYLVEDFSGTFTEVIASGATEGALLLDGPRAQGGAVMSVIEDEWNADYTLRIIHKIAAYSPKAK